MAITSLSRKVHGVELHLISASKKFRAQQSIKKVIVGVFWDTKGPIIVDFLVSSVCVCVCVCARARAHAREKINGKSG